MMVDVAGVARLSTLAATPPHRPNGDRRCRGWKSASTSTAPSKSRLTRLVTFDSEDAKHTTVAATATTTAAMMQARKPTKCDEIFVSLPPKSPPIRRLIEARQSAADNRRAAQFFDDKRDANLYTIEPCTRLADAKASNTLDDPSAASSTSQVARAAC